MLPKNNSIQSFGQAKEILKSAIVEYKPQANVLRIEVKIDPIDQLNWLWAQESPIKIYGANHDDSACIAGVFEAVTIKGEGKIYYPKVFTQLRRYLSPHYPYLQWYGGFSFDAHKKSSLWSGFGSWRFVMPRFELARDKDKMIFCCNLIGKVNKSQVLKQLAALNTNTNKSTQAALKGRLDKPSQKKFISSTAAVVKNIKSGEYEKVVLARQTDFTFSRNLEPWHMLSNLKKVTPNSYHFAFEFNNKVFLGASPERLYKRFGRQIVTEALAGTKPSNAKPEELLNSSKDRAEHDIVVQTIKKDLTALCSQLNVADTPTVRTLSNGHHLHTMVAGHLKDGIKDEDILESLHPTPALGGMPKAKALKVIRQCEPFSRGWYAGPVGYVGLDWVEFVVAIRSGLIHRKKLSVFAGAGIVEGSNPKEEWQEIENKISNFIKIIK